MTEQIDGVNGGSAYVQGLAAIRAEPHSTDGVPPAYDEWAAQRHIASMLVDPEACASLAEHGLTHVDYIGPERAIVQAIEDCMVAGVEVGLVNVGIRLMDHHTMHLVGGLHVLTLMCDKMGLRSKADIHRDAERVRRHSLSRQLRLAHHTAAAEYTCDPMQSEDIFDRFAATMLVMRQKTKPHFEGVGCAEIFGELAPEPYILPDLSIGPGLPTMFAGYSHSGKTMVLMDMILDLAAGRNVWDNYATTKQCKCLHINYDQSARVTFDRYQKLLHSKQYAVEDLGDRLQVVNRPGEFLNSATAKPRLMRRLEGMDVCVIDSLLAALPGQKENDSDIRKYLDELGEISEATGCTVIVIHHSGKRQKGEEVDKRMIPRGSSAIVDAIDNLFLVSPDESEPLYHITQVKNKSAGTRVEFSVRYQNTAKAIWLSNEGAVVPVAPVDEIQAVRGAIVAFLSTLPDKTFIGTRSALSAALRRKHGPVVGALALLETDRKVLVDPRTHKEGGTCIRSLL